MNIEGADRAAILLLGLGEDIAARVLKHLEPRQVQKVGVAMTELASINQMQIESVVADFLKTTESAMTIDINSEEYVRKMLLTAVGEEKAMSFLERILSKEDESGLSRLQWLDAKTVADLIRQEHPQIIATILTYLDPEQAAEVLMILPEERRVDLVLRMSSIESVTPEALEQVGKTIEEQLEGKKSKSTAPIGGVKSVADMINYLDSTIESAVLEGIKEANAELCEQITEKMFVFENISDMDDRSVQTLLRDVQTDVLLIALKGADEAVKNKIFTNMSKRAADLLKDDLEAQAPVKVSEVETAQKEILSTARKLAESGELSLGGKGGEEMI